MKIKALVNTRLKKDYLQYKSGDPTVEVLKDKEYDIDTKIRTIFGHTEYKFSYGLGNWFVFNEHWQLITDPSDTFSSTKQPLLTEAQLKKIIPYASNDDIKTYITPLNKVMEEYEINTRLRIAAFIAQIAHESGSLRYKHELASGQAYENRKDLGNIYPGDGVKYKG